MLPITRWTIWYADGSTFTSEDGTWAQAPAFGVHCVVWYNARGHGVDQQGRDVSIYRWRGPQPTGVVEVEGWPEGGVEPVKMGLWTDGESYWRVHDLLMREVSP